MQHVLIGRGKCGWHSDGLSNGNKCSSSGGSLESYLREADDNTIVYDAYEADDSSFIDWVYKGPMFNPRLLPHEIDSFNGNDKRTLLGMLPSLEGAFKTLGVMALSDLRSLDFVGLDVYLTALRERVPGIKIGKVQNHAIVWE
jgi:hypothetical protein